MRVIAAMLLSASLSAQSQDWIEIAPDVLVVVNAGSVNQVVIVFESFVVVFDPGSVVEARTLANAIDNRTDKPVRYVINSHFHPDHSAGAAVFAAAGAEVVAAESARPDYEVFVREDFANKVASNPEVYRGLQYSPPTLYLEEDWVIDDGEQRLELTHYGHGHTTGDLVGWIPEHKILLPADLSTNGQHNLANASLSGWISILETLRGLEADQVVPGHRELAGPEILVKSYDYIVALRSGVGEMVTRGLTYSEILETIDIPFYEEWSGIPVGDEATNVRTAYLEVGGKMPLASRLRALFTRRRIAALMGLGFLFGGAAAVRYFWIRPHVN